MEVTTSDIEELYIHLGFRKPDTNIQIHAYYQIFKTISTSYTFPEIMELLGLTDYKIKTFSESIAKKWAPAKIEKSLNYYRQYPTEISSIMHAFVMK